MSKVPTKTNLLRSPKPRLLIWVLEMVWEPAPIAAVTNAGDEEEQPGPARPVAQLSITHGLRPLPSAKTKSGAPSRFRSIILPLASKPPAQSLGSTLK